MSLTSMFNSTVSELINPGDIFGQLTGSTKTANAAQKAADLQFQLGEEQLAESKAARGQAIDFAQSSRTQAVALAQPSAAELGQQAQNLHLQSMALSRQQDLLSRDQKLLDSVDPTIKATGEQLYNLVQGKAAPILGPLQTEIDRQRVNLQQKLQSQMGPGWETSTAGIQAMSQFNQSAEMTIANAQNSAIQTLGSTLGITSGVRSGILSGEAQGFGTLNALNQTGIQTAQNQTGRIVNAFNGQPAPNFAPADNSGLINAAGQSQIGTMMQGQAQGQIFNLAAGLAGQYAGSQMNLNTLKQLQTPAQPNTLGMLMIPGTNTAANGAALQTVGDVALNPMG